MDIARRDWLKALAAGMIGAAMLREDWLPRLRAAEQSANGRTPLDLATDENFWFQIQQAYTVDRSLINLNNGGVCPSPRVVQDAQRRHQEFANNAPSRNLWSVQDPQVETVRARLARCFGCDSEEMAITRNASESLQICQYGFDFKPGDEVIATEQDYPRMITTFRQREQREGIKLLLVKVPAPLEDAAAVVEAYRAAITPRTRMLLVSHVSFATGQIFPVREVVRLGRERGIPVIVDGAHAFAHIPLQRDQLECDYYGTSLHKWTCAPHGTGFLFVRRERIGGLWPLMAAPVEKRDDIRKFEEIGTHPAANKLAIAEAVTLLDAIGIERKSARLRYLRDLWAKRLLADSRVKLFTRLDPEHSCAIAVFAIAGIDPAKLVDHLSLRHKIIVTAIDYAGVQGIRVTPNVYTTPEEIDVFCRAVERVMASGLGA